ncbi:MAG: 16S rRNA pseudouridine(516) synthase [Gammaproteobacteria bacterium]|nr:16S rRNA pseudouridine(516) synthase [Gammaproteobacteria bacterium]MBQ0840668.1 16S rRNA pseudouridine(516) synthase [Gammaproteobacteria bacterium]
MISARTRLDRFMSRQLGIKRQAIRPILAQGRVLVDGYVARDAQQSIHQFTHVSFDQRVLQNNQPHYVMMNKPKGVVSATKDQHHKTLIDLLERDDKEDLHIAGRLDFNSSGLILLTNDGRWSRQLSSPSNKIVKRYRVELEKPLTEDYIHAFAKGMFFDFEGITTQPATLKIISPYIGEVSLIEGRYHQIKRMFGRFQNKVLQLHRLSIGNLALDAELLPGQYRELSPAEVDGIFAIE